MAIAGCLINRDNSNNQPSATNNKQIATKPESMKTTTINIMQHFKYANTVPTVLCMNNNLICGYTVGVHLSLYTNEMQHQALCEICRNPSEL